MNVSGLDVTDTRQPTTDSDEKKNSIYHSLSN